MRTELVWGAIVVAATAIGVRATAASGAKASSAAPTLIAEEGGK